jgi:hypothetical protein
MTTPPSPDRKPRCLRLVEHANGLKFRPPDQCQNERLPGSALCAHHLGDAVNEFRQVTTQPGEDA